MGVGIVLTQGSCQMSALAEDSTTATGIGVRTLNLAINLYCSYIIYE